MITTTTSLKPTSTRTQVDHYKFFIDRNVISELHYFDYPYIKRSLKVGDALSLKRESRNPYDKNSIAIWFCGRKLGYWPSPENKALANMMDKGLHLRGKIVDLKLERNDDDSSIVVESFVRM